MIALFWVCLRHHRLRVSWLSPIASLWSAGPPEARSQGARDPHHQRPHRYAQRVVADREETPERSGARLPSRSRGSPGGK